ncbi:hypothetical protein WD019_10170 [Fictibacillus sp. Mic-4]|uniref:hypothetical protein n=1 Tax=Fictibacillus sp. Mic-4 TaxID=3132826 RepID=UPI003CF9949B
MGKKYLVTLLSIVTVIIFIYFSFDFFKGNHKNTLSKTMNRPEISTIEEKNKNIDIEIPSHEIFSYGFYKDDIYMSIDENSKSKLGNKIVHYNLKTKKKTILFTSNFDNSSVQGIKVNNKWVTWIDADDYGEQRNIYAMNKRTREIKRITNHNQTVVNGFPSLSGHYLSWIYYDKNKKRSYVMLRDLYKKKIKLYLY